MNRIKQYFGSKLYIVVRSSVVVVWFSAVSSGAVYQCGSMLYSVVESCMVQCCIVWFSVVVWRSVSVWFNVV